MMYTIILYYIAPLPRSPDCPDTTAGPDNDASRVGWGKNCAGGDVLVVLRRRSPSRCSDEW